MIMRIVILYKIFYVVLNCSITFNLAEYAFAYFFCLIGMHGQEGIGKKYN